MRKNVLVLFISFICIHTSAQNKIVELLNSSSRNLVQNIYHEIIDEDGNRASIPISVILGKKEGPIFTVVAGVHGFEYPPIIAAQEVIQKIDPGLLNGTLIVIPLANPSAFYNRTPFLNPQDNLNLNRSFPGDSNGSITERTASFLTTEIIARTDYFIDIHGGDANEDLLPFICYYHDSLQRDQTQMAIELTSASGFEYVVSYPYTISKTDRAKYAFKQAVQDGKVAMSIECGKLGNVQKEAVEIIQEGLFNILAELKMYPSQVEFKKQPTQFNKQAYIKSKHKGIFFSDLKSGDQVVKEEKIGMITDPFGNIISELFAPNSGTILYKIGTPPVNVNETIMCIAYHN